jgi:hypothetical protein
MLFEALYEATEAADEADEASDEADEEAYEAADVADFDADDADAFRAGLSTDLDAADAAEEAADESEAEIELAAYDAAEEADEADALYISKIRIFNLRSAGRSGGGGRGGAGGGSVGIVASRGDGNFVNRRDGRLGLFILFLGSQLGRGEQIEDLAELVFGKFDTAVDGVTDSLEDLLKLVASLDVADWD